MKQRSLCAAVVCLLSLFVFTVVAQGESSSLVITQERIEQDATWQGEVHIPHKVTIAAGVTVRIAPGTVVRFAAKRGMWVEGSLIAQGEEDRPILFSVLGGEGAAHWHQIRFEKGRGVFSHCRFVKAEIALHAHFSAVDVRHCLFQGNETGMMFQGGPVSIRSSTFTKNGFGLVFNKAQGAMLASVVERNEVGIMVRNQEGEAMRVADSALHVNSRYNLKMGDFNDGFNIDVRNNWWGVADPAATIFDDRVEPGIGRALIEPVLSQRPGR